ncbi:hypothetical protein OPV22_015686 [Ensete ventricosum]|uniref:Cytosolic Fe-S cluster assembly factor NBP35 n=1 Tax=Ensete ventricosum TaxID=4639 RepID=A0AAV8R4F0_ENSVE|nr:hypothetical protein OPV22_015686 [Ensete ventricosum]
MDDGNHQIPENANEHCSGLQSEEAGKADACAGCPNQQICDTAPKGPDPDLVTVAERMATIKHKIRVLSGKGGVGKSTFSAQLSFALAEMDSQDIHQSNLGWSPVYVESNLGVMSISFMLPNPDDAVILRGTRKNGLIKQFLKDVDWGIDGAIIVTTPQQVSLIDVRKEISFCKKVGIQVLGVVENMSELRLSISDFRFLKPTETGDWNDVTEWALSYIRSNALELLSVISCSEVFDTIRGGAAKMCAEMGVPFLGKVPMDPHLCRAAEEVHPCFTDQKCTVSAPAPRKIIKKLVSSCQ